MADRLKIYFACSISGEKGGSEEKTLIVRTLQSLGHTVLTEIFHTKQNRRRGKLMGPLKIFKEDMDWIKEADILVADVSRVSMGVGYEIGWSIASGKRVVALCKKDREHKLSFMILGNIEKNFSLHFWEDEVGLKRILEKELGDATK